MFNPMPYHGYQPANNPNNTAAPPPYGEPPARYAQFDAPGHRGVGKGDEDALPTMPSWKDAQSRRVEDQGPPGLGHGGDMEMGNLQKPTMTSATHFPAQPQLQQHYNHSAVEVDSRPITGSNTVSAGYTGPDFGAAQHTAYTGPDFSTPPLQQQNTAYSAYAPSESTRYEPSHANEPQELGTTYNSTLPLPNPSAQQTSLGGRGGAPGVLQAGRNQGQGQGGWRDV
ncbi:MAG: hypothetical protein Q9163_004874 [Psora crenata]